METIGQRIKKRREELGLSADKVAEYIGKDRITIYRYESGQIKDMPVSIIEPLAEVLNTTPLYLMGWVDNNQSLTTPNNAFLDNAELSLLTKYRALNNNGKLRVKNYLDDLTASGNY